MNIRSVYGLIRPLLWRFGLLPLLRVLLPPKWRAKIAKNIGLGSYSPPPPPRAPYRGAVESDGVNYVADLRVDIGIGESARVIHSTLLTAGVEVNYQEVEMPWIQRTTPIETTPNPKTYTITLAHLNPSELRLGFDRYPKLFHQCYTIAHWYWEVPRFPPAWIPYTQVLDELWTSSRYTQNILAQVASIPVHYFPTPVIVTPEPVTRAQFGIAENRFMFFFAFNPGSSVARKNPYALIEAYKRAFGGMNNPPQLVIKAHHLSQHPAIAAVLKKAVEQVGGILIKDHLTRSQMHGLINLSDCVVSLHRAEGFGLLMAEAMAMEKPVIATGYSSNMDFMNERNSFLVDYSLCEITPDDHKDQPLLGNLYTSGQVWADPDIDHAAQLMQQVYNNPTLAQARAQIAKHDITTGWSAETVGKLIKQRLQEIAQTHG